MKAKFCRVLSANERFGIQSGYKVKSVVYEDEEENELIYGVEINRWGEERTELAVYPFPEGMEEFMPGHDCFISDGYQTKGACLDWLVSVHEKEVPETDRRVIKILSDYNMAVDGLQQRKDAKEGNVDFEGLRRFARDAGLPEEIINMMIDDLKGE